MSKRFNKRQALNVNVNLTPTKRRKKQPNHKCILNCTVERKEHITKFSETSREIVHNAAYVRKDDKILALLASYSNDKDLFTSDNGYHRKCYQKYTHKRLLEKLSKKPSKKAVRTSLRKKERKGKKTIFVVYKSNVWCLIMQEPARLCQV